MGRAKMIGQSSVSGQLSPPAATTSAPCTPKSAGRSFRSLRRGLFQDEDEQTPVKETSLQSDIVRRKASSATIPDKFRRMMPTSARKTEPEPVQPSQRGLPSIVKTSFYGKSPKLAPSLHSSSAEEKPKPLKPHNSNRDAKDALRAKSALRRRSSGHVTKRKKHGMNKGVSHAIKKPSKKKLMKLLKRKELKEARKAVAKERVKNDFKKKFFEDLEEDEKKLNKKARKSGKLFMTKQTNVSYEIKNGQPVFHLRRSPRKAVSPYFKEITPTVNRSSNKLFTPSGDSDFLQGGGSPSGKSRRTFPSPVKFDCKDPEDDELDHSVQNIITNLDNDDTSHDVNVSQDEYAIYVNDDELAKVAMETANQLATISEPEDTSVTIQNILANMKSPTKEEREERRSIAKPKKSDSSLYSIFSPRVTRSSSNSPAKSKMEKKRITTSTTSDYPKDGMKQMVIDAGQKVIGAQYCLLCDFVYTAGCQEEEKVHEARHRMADGHIRFPGWKNENIQGEFADGRVVVVKSGDARRHWEKVGNVLQHIDNVLGIGPEDNAGSRIRNPGKTKAYMFIAEGKVVGFLLAEILENTDKISISSLISNSSQEGQRCLKDVKPKKTISVGVNRIWVCPTHQRKGIATRLTDIMRRDFLMPAKALKKDEFAFSHTTPIGSEFASNYVGNSDFLVYAPALPGDSSH